MIVRAHRTRLSARTASVLLVACAAAGCQALSSRTEPARLWSLELPAAVPVQADAACPVRFAVRELRLAGYLDRPEVVLARDGSRLDVSAADLWAASLQAELRRAIGTGISARLPGAVGVPHPWRFDEAPRFALGIDIERLDPQRDALQATFGWRVVDVRDGRTLAAGRLDERLPLGSSTERARAVADAIGAAAMRLAAAASADVRAAAQSVGACTAPPATQ